MEIWAKSGGDAPSPSRIGWSWRLWLLLWEYTMNQAQLSLRRALVLSCIVIGYASLGFGQASDPKSAAIIEQIMTTALSRCYSTVDGVKRITFESPPNEEFTEVEALGQKAVAPLARYLDLQPKNGFTQLFAVKFRDRRLFHVRSSKKSLCSRPMGGHQSCRSFWHLCSIAR